MTMEQIFSEALRLSREERARLAEVLISSLDEDAEIEYAWRQEIERRVIQVREGHVQMEDGDEVIARLRERLRERGA